MTTPLPETKFEALRAHLLEHSVKRGDFTLKSGRKSSWFIDSKQTVCRPEAMVLVADGILSVLPDDARPIIDWLLAKDPAERPARASALLPVLWGVAVPGVAALLTAPPPLPAPPAALSAPPNTTGC